MQKNRQTKISPHANPNPNQPVKALRKSCTADGVGLSHYILMDEKAK
ncbi:MAG: modified peptide precursor CbpA [Magnetococcales bacterium]|nr:modified peptide precursor CbpA [Magnetococcales bacterium]